MKPVARGGVMNLVRRAFTEHVGLKVLSIVAAIVLFSLVRGAEDAQRSMFVEVVALLPPEGSTKVLISELPDRVKVTLRGSRSLLNSVRREELEPMQVDLTDPELRYFYFEPTAIEVPAGISVVQLAPASIPLTWADEVERRLPVTAQLVGEPGEGVAVRRPPLLEPPTVLLRGAQSELDRLAAVLTEPIDVAGLRPGRHERRVRLTAPPPHAAYDRGDATVRVLLDVEPVLETRSFRGLSVEIVGAVGRVRPEAVGVVVEGRPDLVAGLEASRLVPWVDAAALDGAGALPATVALRGVPEGCTVRAIEPAEVLLTILRRAPAPAPAPAP